MYQKDIITKCKLLLQAYKDGKLWYMKMPEDENPGFSVEEQEFRLAYFTLPMALNYQRNSYTLRESAKKTYEDPETRDVFDIQKINKMNEALLREKLLKYKVALQPIKHGHSRKTISTTISEHRWSLRNLFEASNYDFLNLKNTIQIKYKSGFPYLSWPKIFNYWSFIIQSYGWIVLKNSEYIEIAPDTHVTKCSVKLWLITQQESENLSKEQLSEKWRDLLQWTWINPIDMHSPLWFWSRNNFLFQL